MIHTTHSLKPAAAALALASCLLALASGARAEGGLKLSVQLSNPQGCTRFGGIPPALSS